MRIGIDKDELYPFYAKSVSRSMLDVTFDVPVETLERWKQVMSDFYDVQAEMEAYYRAN